MCYTDRDLVLVSKIRHSMRRCDKEGISKILSQENRNKYKNKKGIICKT